MLIGHTLCAMAELAIFGEAIKAWPIESESIVPSG